jgi:signal transduction histidine kinase
MLARQHLTKVFASREIQVFEYQHSSLLGLQNFEARLVASGPDEVLAIIRNITERKQAEQQAIRTERLAALGRLAATLAHELNNPLQVAQSNLDLILDFPLEPGESEKYLQIVRQEIQHLRDIAQRVLNYAHPKPEPRQEVIIADLVQQVLKLTNKRLEQTGTEVTSHFEEVPPVLAARNQLAQVFLNLIINATEALEAEGKLQIAVYRVDNEVAVSFTNNGPVIPEEILTYIFEPFFTTKPEGSGLGLWVSHSLVQQHSGSLTVENLGEQRGVVFTVKLPAAIPAVE